MKPSIPKGTRDMNPVEMQKRNFIFDTIKKQFQLFGFDSRLFLIDAWYIYFDDNT